MSELVVLGLMDSAAILTANPADQYRNSVAFRLGVKSIATAKMSSLTREKRKNWVRKRIPKGFR